jgi:hypothetical protein
LEEDGRFPQDALGLLELPLLLDQGLPTRVHLSQPALVLGELVVEVVDRLRTSRADGDKGRGRFEGRDVDERRGDGVDLGGEEPDSTFHLVESSDVTDKGSLEGVDLGVELERGREESRKGDQRRLERQRTKRVSCSCFAGPQRSTRVP